MHCTQRLSEVQTGVALAQAPLAPVVPSFAAGLQVTHALFWQAGVAVGQEWLVPLAFCASRQGTQVCVLVLQAGVAPLQSEVELQPKQVPSAVQTGCALGQSPLP